LSAWTVTKLKLFQINRSIQIAIMWSHQQSKFIMIELKHEDVNFLWRCRNSRETAENISSIYCNLDKFYLWYV
jgi:hypothetical protein